MNDTKKYNILQEKQAIDWENTCINCGACCGVYDNDPCTNLVKKENNKYFCSNYNNRFGPQKTVSGKIFNCVPIRQIIDLSWPGDRNCAYKKLWNEIS